MAFDHAQRIAHVAALRPQLATPGSIAVLVINYNSGPLLLNAIASLCVQRRAADEIIVVDNGSTDQSLDRVPWAMYPHIRLVRLRENVGFAAASNLAARLAVSDWLAMLNCDAAADPEWLAALAAAADRNRSVGIFTSTQARMDSPERLDGAGDVFSVTGLAWRGGYGRPSANLPAEGTCFGACAAGAFIARQLFVDLGGFEESFFCYLEDLDFSYRARLTGQECIYVPNARILHKGAASSAGTRDWPLRVSARNRVLMFLRNTPLLLALLTWPLLVVGAALAICQGARHGHALSVLRGYRDALQLLPEALEQRRRLAPPWVPPVSLLRPMSWNPIAILSRSHRVQPVRPRSTTRFRRWPGQNPPN